MFAIVFKLGNEDDPKSVLGPFAKKTGAQDWLKTNGWKFEEDNLWFHYAEPLMPPDVKWAYIVPFKKP